MIFKSDRRFLSAGDTFQNPGNTQDESFVDWLRGNSYDRLSINVMWMLHDKVAPFFNAVDIRSDAVKSIPFYLSKDGVKREKDHKVTQLMRSPSIGFGCRKLIEAISKEADVTGNFAYIITSLSDGDPLEIYPAEIRYMSMVETAVSMFPTSILYSPPNKPQDNFFIDESGSRLRYLNRDKNKELVIDNGFSSCGKFIGDSMASPIWSELEQYGEGNTNNLSLLKRGARPSFIVSIKNAGANDAPALKEIKRKLSEYQSSHNTGTVPVLPDADIKNIMSNNRDMQFLENRSAVKEQVYNQYRIPLELITTSSSTFNNKSESKKMLFTDAAFPLMDRILESFDRYILSRYRDLEGYEFEYTEEDIPALRQTMLEQAKLMSEIGVHSADEIRASLGDTDLKSGGTQVRDKSSKIIGDTDKDIEVSNDDLSSLS